MVFLDLYILMVITLILCLTITDRVLLLVSCFILGVVSGVYRGLHPKKRKDDDRS
jgi:hypothetical protein